ncbi:MAG: NUDIX domain-containing protein [SAR324 cluster bacterium]
MMRWALFAGVYGWLGFTVGYYFRKWLERSWLPRFRVEAAQRRAAEERVDWVDEDDLVLQVLPRREIHRRNLLHRVTAAFVFHPDGRLFLQQRTMTKDVYPGLFDPCVGGTVASGETYARNAAREVAEELGIGGAPLYFLFGHRFRDESTNSLIRVFACIAAGPFTLQASEVAGGEWVQAAQVDERIAQGRVCPDSAAGWRLYLKRFGPDRNFEREIAPALDPVGRTGT